MSQHKGQLTVAFVSTAQQTNKSRFTLVGVQKYALDVASWHFSEVLRCPFHNRYRGKSGSDTDIIKLSRRPISDIAVADPDRIACSA
jgi:hypothetical protein